MYDSKLKSLDFGLPVGYNKEFEDIVMCIFHYFLTFYR